MYICVCIHIHIHTHILLVLFLWRTLTDTMIFSFRQFKNSFSVTGNGYLWFFFVFVVENFFFFYFFFIFKLYNIVLVLPYINMNPPQVYTCSPSWTFLPPCTIPLSHPSAPAPSIQYCSSNLDWRLFSYIILFMFQCHSPKSSHPLPLPQSP